MEFLWGRGSVKFYREAPMGRRVARMYQIGQYKLGVFQKKGRIGKNMLTTVGWYGVGYIIF